MIGIKISGKYLKLKPATVVNLHMENPLFADNDTVVFPGAYSLPFDLPAPNDAPENAALLNHHDIVERAGAFSTIKSSLEISNISFLKGDLKINEVLPEAVNVNFNFGVQTINPDIRTRKLRDLINEEVVISSAPVLKKVYIKPKDGNPYSIQVNGSTYTGTLTQIRDAINADAIAANGTGELIANAFLETVGNTPGGMTPNYLRIQMVRDFVVMSQDPLEPLAVKAPDDTQDPADAWTIEADLDGYYDAFDTFLAGYISGVYPSNKIRFPLTFNAQTLNTTTDADKAQKWNDHVNAVDAGGIMKNNPNLAPPLNNINSLQAYVRLRYVLEQIATFIGNLTLSGDFVDNVDLMERLIDNSELLDEPLEFIHGYQFLFWKRSFNLANLLPDITVLDFLKGLAQRYNLMVQVQGAKLLMAFKEPIIAAFTFQDITAAASPRLGLKSLEKNGVRLSVDVDETDLIDQPELKLVGNFIGFNIVIDHEVKITCGHILQSKTSLISGKQVSGPYVSRKQSEKFKLRLFQYTGIANTGTFTYPSAATTGSSFTDRIDSTLFDNFHRQSIRMLRQLRVVKINVNFSLAAILSFNWLLKRRYDRVNYFVKSIDVKIGDTGIEVTGTELYKA